MTFSFSDSPPFYLLWIKSTSRSPPFRPTMDSDESGEDMMAEESDYKTIPELDRYEEDMLDDRPSLNSFRREALARLKAEEVMAARDSAGKSGRAGGTLHKGTEGGGSRVPRALEQVKANRASNVELQRYKLSKCEDCYLRERPHGC